MKNMKINTMNSAVMFAEDIMQMQYELESLRYEVEELREYKQKYNDLLNSSIKHGNEMSKQVLELLLNGGKFNVNRTNMNNDKEMI